MENSEGESYQRDPNLKIVDLKPLYKFGIGPGTLWVKVTEVLSSTFTSRLSRRPVSVLTKTLRSDTVRIGSPVRRDVSGGTVVDQSDGFEW